MGWVQPVTFPDGRVHKALVSRVTSTAGCIIGEDPFPFGRTEYGVVRRKNVVYHVTRCLARHGQPWTAWTVSSVIATRTRSCRPPFAPEAVEEAVRIARQEERSVGTLARILDGDTFGWDDARSWMYLTRVKPSSHAEGGRYFFREAKRFDDAWWIHCGITEATALARMALRRVGGKFDPPPERENPNAALEEALWRSIKHRTE